MVTTANQEATGGLLLEVALEAQVRIALDKHLCIHGAVRLVAGDATLPDGLVFKRKRPALRRMAATAGVEFRQQRRAATLDCRTPVWVMAILTGHLARKNWMRVRQAELAALVEVTLEAHLGRPARVDDRAASTA